MLECFLGCFPFVRFLFRFAGKGFMGSYFSAKLIAPEGKTRLIIHCGHSMYFNVGGKN